MFDIKIEGLDKAIAALDGIARKIKLADGQEIPVPDGMTPEQAADQWLKNNIRFP